MVFAVKILLFRIVNKALGPNNSFEEMIQWTEEGKMWPYPINNEYQLGEELDVCFLLLNELIVRVVIIIHIVVTTERAKKPTFAFLAKICQKSSIKGIFM